jgi:hypothetical protein
MTATLVRPGRRDVAPQVIAYLEGCALRAPSPDAVTVPTRGMRTRMTLDKRAVGVVRRQASPGAAVYDVAAYAARRKRRA